MGQTPFAWDLLIPLSMRALLRFYLWLVLPVSICLVSCSSEATPGGTLPQIEPSSSPSPPPGTVRPLQYVEIAFDGGSGNHAFWKETLDFARASTNGGNPVRFTYFASGAFFLTDRTRTQYEAPREPPGRSNVGFSADDGEVFESIARVNESIEAGHEIGSHAVGHFDGSDWSSAEWRDELGQYLHFILDVFTTNSLRPGPGDPTTIAISRDRIVGFRAPYLAVSSGLRPALRDLGFRYDTSRTGSPTSWPVKDAYGIWNFPLAELKIARTGESTLSMDYNFYVAQSGAEEDPANSEIYRRQMLETYLRYFERNYNEGRAPLHIGHHLDRWNGSAYWNALKDFVSLVCGLPETRCITYTELAETLDRTGAKTLSDYRAGRFPKTPTPVHFSLPWFVKYKPLKIKHLGKAPKTLYCKYK